MDTLSLVETRILGCLLEKEATTPENYPLSLNSLTSACNQTTNRDPVLALDETAVQAGLDALREKKLATVVFGAGSRVQKYRHNFLDHYELNRQDVALMCVLLLRGPQTPGELRQRTERMASFGSLPEVEAALEALGRGEDPLVGVIPAGGRREKRYGQLLSGPLPEPENVAAPAPVTLPPSRTEERLAALEQEMAALREEFAVFRRQFEP